LILEHPKLRGLSLSAPNTNLEQFRIDLNEVEQDESLIHDPLQPDTEKTWVAGMAEVKRTSRDRDDPGEGESSTGLIVIAAQDYDAVTEPVRSLERQLSRLALGTLMFVLAVVGLLVFMLSRTFRQTRKRMAANLAPATDSLLIKAAESTRRA
jgi:hypothetical protein